MKRIFDFIASFIFLVSLFPVFLFLSYKIRKYFGSPIFFKQKRPGLHSKPFVLIKFRTMRDEYDQGGNLLPDEERMPVEGAFIRSTSLDELPALWNVLKGDMSLVGPRPLLMEYLPLYSDEQARRHQVRPGITGWAQINGRNSISWEDKFKFDIWYVDNQSFFLDIKILFLSMRKVVSRVGINFEGHVTAEKFKGSKVTDGK